MAYSFQSTHAGDLANSRSQDARIRWAVVAQNATGASYLFIVDLCAADTGQLVLEKIRKEYNCTTASTCKENWVSKLFTKVVMGSAEVQWVHSYAFMLYEESD
jgi:hypothetical protein